MKARNDNRRSKFYFSKIYGLSSNFENSKFDAHSFKTNFAVILSMLLITNLSLLKI